MAIINKDIGSCISVHIGNSADESIRYKAASGGVVTSLLIYMFDEKLIDAAIVVAAKKDEPQLSAATILNNRDNALVTSGSRYIFVSIRPELEKLLNLNKKVAIVGLPCEIRTIKKSLQLTYENNIKLCIGLFCGYALSPVATEFILHKLRLRPQDLRSFEYRTGKWPGYLRIKTKDGRVFSFSRTIYNILNPLFERESCIYCDDLFNEYSDISIGDAWYGLPDKKGYSTVIIRNKRGEYIFNDAVKKGYIAQRQIEPEILYKSHGHLIKYKKRHGSLLRIITYMIRSNWLGRFLKILPLRLLYGMSKLYHRRIRI